MEATRSTRDDRVFAGIICDSDFNIKHYMSNEAYNICYWRSFDRKCKEAIEKREQGTMGMWRF